MVTGPGDELAASAAARERLRASHADRERVIDILKVAFVQGMLAKDEFDLRVSQAFASRTCAELAALTADLPPMPTSAQPPKPARAEGEQPVLRPGPVIMAATALCGGVWAFTFLPPWAVDGEGDPPHAVILLFLSANLLYLFVMVIAVGYMIARRREKRTGGRPASGASGQVSGHPPSAGPGRELPLVDRGQQHTAEAERSRPARPPGRARGHRGDGIPAGCLP